MLPLFRETTNSKTNSGRFVGREGMFTGVCALRITLVATVTPTEVSSHSQAPSNFYTCKICNRISQRARPYGSNMALYLLHDTKDAQPGTHAQQTEGRFERKKLLSKIQPHGVMTLLEGVLSKIAQNKKNKGGVFRAYWVAQRNKKNETVVSRRVAKPTALKLQGRLYQAQRLLLWYGQLCSPRALVRKNLCQNHDRMVFEVLQARTRVDAAMTQGVVFCVGLRDCS